MAKMDSFERYCEHRRREILHEISRLASGVYRVYEHVDGRMEERGQIAIDNFRRELRELDAIIGEYLSRPTRD